MSIQFIVYCIKKLINFNLHQLCVYRKPTTKLTSIFLSQYIIAGSLTIAAEKSLNKFLVSNVELT